MPANSTLVDLLKKALSFSGDAHKVTTYADDATTAGKAFLFEKNISIDTGATALVLFDYTTYVKKADEAGLIFVFPPLFSTTIGPVTVNLYRDTDYSGGTKFDAINPNTTAIKKHSATTLTLAPTGSVKGTLSMTYLVGGQSQGNQTAPGSAQGLSFFIIDNTRKSLVEIVNGSGSAITFHYGQTLYEI